MPSKDVWAVTLTGEPDPPRWPSGGNCDHRVAISNARSGDIHDVSLVAITGNARALFADDDPSGQLDLATCTHIVHKSYPLIKNGGGRTGVHERFHLVKHPNPPPPMAGVVNQETLETTITFLDSTARAKEETIFVDYKLDVP